MDRRRFLATSAGLVAAGAAPARAQRNDRRVLRFVPQANLTALDPVWTTAAVTSVHGYTVFDTLYGTDDSGRIRPQMAEGHSVSDDGLTWTIRLREGLRWHDGERVLARDCVASLQRWSRRDVFGQSLAAAVEEWGTTDDRTLRIRLKTPFPMLLSAIGKTASNMPLMMPERLARTDPFRQVTEMVGSGPYRFLQDEYVSGSRVAYAKFDGYVPRQEPAENTAGGKVAHFERIEWHVLPDSATAAAALQAGEVDWWDQVNPDLTPLLRRSRNLRVAVNDPAGYIGTLRFNHLHAPFDKAAVRRAILYAAKQDDYLRAITGNDPEIFSECHSMWPCGTPYGRETIPPELLGKPADMDRAKQMLRDGGYNGEKVVIINPSDLPSIAPFGLVTADLLSRLGMNVELIETDWGSVVQRRVSKEPIDRGGWSIFHTWWPSPSILNPATSPILRGQGERGWFGWYSNPRVEELAAQWLQAPTEAEQAQLAEEIQQESFREVPVVPLGRYFIRTAYDARLTGFLKSASSYPWNVRWA
ncbi:ABC transporter substrate-binding protein [Roseomonas frigidaquae]|uniref:ABC transporter substrate-binding protein n=1 Tax=Falsiroseomonas frigidaquae TaxID=487318 RepID=A0ABX1EWJ9_9PROT|nr:ABC transporter substrate-binding protein [Falsiroseomonas frigidaquae]NKE43987.1 ABC transporter substrate-binding protein [Falsiroseomonas frigidaquae]